MGLIIRGEWPEQASCFEPWASIYSSNSRLAHQCDEHRVNILICAAGDERGRCHVDIPPPSSALEQSAYKVECSVREAGETKQNKAVSWLTP